MTDHSPPIALVTGAAKRIGRSIARRLVEEGFAIGLHYNRSRGDAERFAEELRALGARVAPLQADLSNCDDTLRLVPACAEALGPPDCLVNNASIFERDTVRDFNAESWQAHQDINLRAPVMLAQAFEKALPTGQNGNIINIIDQRVLRPTPDFFSYTLSKSALWTATRTMAQALAPNIRVNAIAPGPVLPNSYQSEADFAREWESTLLRHGAKPEEIAEAVVFILRARAMTGQMITLDGGEHLQ
jgi:NAD(P)-dependent dehydrogenase (short-subunit alcohol dehydrogenase family)